MQSHGSTSSQPSFDSLNSSDSFLFSDSEQAEDDTDVFLSEPSPSVTIGDGGVVRGDGSDGVESPGSQWACDGFTDREDSERSEGTRSHLRVEESERTREREREKTEGDLLFAQKCAELQGFVRPLLELLNGLKRGRFNRGLSSFQQSVAMDRIQRIVGVLQKPNSGEKYMNTLLQVETMLKLWFPQISPLVPPPPPTTTPPEGSPSETQSCTPPHKHRDQLHIPVKKRRLSWSDTDSRTPPPTFFKRLHTSGGEERGKQGGNGGESSPPSVALGSAQNPLDHTGTSAQENERKEQKGDNEEREGETSSFKVGHTEPSLTWVHVAPILSPPKSCPPHKGITGGKKGKQLLPAIPHPTTRGSPAMQDSSISSTTTYNDPKRQQQEAECQSQPIARQQTESMTLETCQGLAPLPVVAVKPSSRAELKSRVGPAPLET